MSDWKVKFCLAFVFLMVVVAASAQTFPAVPTSNATDTREHIDRRKSVKPYGYQRPGKKVRKSEELTQREGKSLKKGKRKNSDHSSPKVFKKHNNHARANARQRQKSIRRQMVLGTKFD